MTVGRRIRSRTSNSEETADTLPIENVEAGFGAGKRVGRVNIAKERDVRIKELRQRRLRKHQWQSIFEGKVSDPFSVTIGHSIRERK